MPCGLSHDSRGKGTPMARSWTFVRLLLGAVLVATALRVSPGLAQSSEETKLVFEHVIPNIDGKRMVAVVVTYPPGGKSMPHHHAGSAFIYAHVLSGAIRSRVDNDGRTSIGPGKAFMRCPARITGSVKMRATRTLRRRGTA